MTGPGSLKPSWTNASLSQLYLGANSFNVRPVSCCLAQSGHSPASMYNATVLLVATSHCIAQDLARRQPNSCMQGSLPAEWGMGLSSLTVLDLSANNITALLPSSWGTAQGLSQLLTVKLHDNSLAGPIPQEWFERYVLTAAAHGVYNEQSPCQAACCYAKGLIQCSLHISSACFSAWSW